MTGIMDTLSRTLLDSVEASLVGIILRFLVNR